MTRFNEITNAANEIKATLERHGANLNVDDFRIGAEWADNNPVNPWHDAKKELPSAKKVPDIPDYSCSADCVVKVGDSSFYKIAAYDHHFECWCDANDYETIVRNVTKWMPLPESPKKEN